MLAKKHLAQESTDGPGTGLTRGSSHTTLLAQGFDQPLGLRCGARAVDAFQDYQFAADQGFTILGGLLQPNRALAECPRSYSLPLCPALMRDNLWHAHF
jgi:hypothetical protein